MILYIYIYYIYIHICIYIYIVFILYALVTWVTGHMSGLEEVQHEKYPGHTTCHRFGVFIKILCRRSLAITLTCTRKADSWVFFLLQRFGYGSIPINTIFRWMNIHLPAILGFTRGTRVLTHPHLAKSNMNHERWLLRRLCLHMGQILCTVKSLHDPFLSFANGVNGLAIQRSILELYMHMLPWVEVATEQNSLRLAEWFERTEWLLMIAALRLWFFGTQIATKTCQAKLKLAKKRKERADEAVNQTTIYWC